MTITNLDIDSRKVLRKLYFENSQSVAGLSKELNVSIPRAMKTLTELLKLGFIKEEGFAPSTGGRRPVMYSLTKDLLYVVSVALDQFVTRIVIHDLAENTIGGVETHEITIRNDEESLIEVIALIDDAIKRSGIERKKILGVGIGMPGFIDVSKGLNYSYFHVDGDTMVSYMTRKLGFPVYIDNDSSLIALAELRFGAARNTKNSMVLNMSWGIGLGMVLDEKIFRGHNGFAGEFSHMSLFQNGRLCVCGKQGCLETEASLAVVIERAIAGIEEGKVTKMNGISLKHLDKSIEIFLENVRRGDKFAIELLSEAAYKIGQGVAILIHLLNPEVIIISGRGSLVGKILQAPIQQALNEHCIPRLYANTIMRVSNLGMNAQLLGGAALVIEYLTTEETKAQDKAVYPAFST
ncbi:MAG: ROK family transcriptional regulator [Flavitalea sp.]